jgi:hypothetical protein
MIHWVKTSDELPLFDELLWLKQRDLIFIGCRSKIGGRWVWCVHDGVLFIRDGKLVSDECEADDIYPDGWAYVN